MVSKPGCTCVGRSSKCIFRIYFAFKQLDVRKFLQLSPMCTQYRTYCLSFNHTIFVSNTICCSRHCKPLTHAHTTFCHYHTPECQLFRYLGLLRDVRGWYRQLSSELFLPYLDSHRLLRCLRAPVSGHGNLSGGYRLRQANDISPLMPRPKLWFMSQYCVVLSVKSHRFA